MLIPYHGLTWHHKLLESFVKVELEEKAEESMAKLERELIVLYHRLDGLQLKVFCDDLLCHTVAS